MPRIRTIKPDFFRDGKLQDIQADNPTLNPMLVFAGLWTVADKNGVFEWDPRSLKLDILPFLAFDLGASLVLLERFSLISRFEHSGRMYGVVLNFSKHQRINGKELQTSSKYPEPKQGSIGEVPEKQLEFQEGKGREVEGKGEQVIPPDLHSTQYAVRLLQEIGYPEARANIVAIAAAMDSEVRLGKGKPAAFEFILACTRDSIDEGVPITTFFFTEAKYRPENRRNGNGSRSKPSMSSERAQRSKENILAGIEADARRRAASDSA